MKVCVCVCARVVVGGGGGPVAKRGKKETIILVVVLCAVDSLGRVKKKLSARKMSCVAAMQVCLYCLVFITSAT